MYIEIEVGRGEREWKGVRREAWERGRGSYRTVDGEF